MYAIVYGVYDNSGFYKHGGNGWVYLSDMVEGTRKSIYAMSREELDDIKKEIKLLVADPRLLREVRGSLYECYLLAKLRRDCEDAYERMCQRAEYLGTVICKDVEETALSHVHTIDEKYKKNCNNVV